MTNGVIGFLIFVQFFITMLFYPLRIGAKGHVSLAHDKIEIDIILAGFAITRLRIKKHDGKFKLQVNGKAVKSENNSFRRNFSSIIRQYKVEGLKLKGNLLALIGTHDAKTTAILCAAIKGVLQPVLSNLMVFTAQPSDTLEADGRLKIKINVLQLLNMIAAGLRGENG